MYKMDLMNYLQNLSPEDRDKLFNRVEQTPDTNQWAIEADKDTTPVDQRMSTDNRTDYPQSLDWPNLKSQPVNSFTLAEEQPNQWISLQDMSQLTWVEPSSNEELQNQVSNDMQKVVPIEKLTNEYDKLQTNNERIKYLQHIKDTWGIIKKDDWTPLNIDNVITSLQVSNNTNNTNNTDNIDNTTKPKEPKAGYFSNLILWNLTNFMWSAAKWLVDTMWTANKTIWYLSSLAPKYAIKADNALLKMFWRKPMANNIDKQQKEWSDAVDASTKWINDAIWNVATFWWYFWWAEDHPITTMAWDIAQFAMTLAIAPEVEMPWFIEKVTTTYPSVAKYISAITNATEKLAKVKWVRLTWKWVSYLWKTAWKSIWQLVAFNASKWKWTSENELIAAALLWVGAHWVWVWLWWAMNYIKKALNQMPPETIALLKQMTPEEVDIALKSLKSWDTKSIVHNIEKAVEKYKNKVKKVPSGKVLAKKINYNIENLPDKEKIIPAKNVINDLNKFLRWDDWTNTITTNDKKIVWIFNQLIKNNTTKKWFISPKTLSAAKSEVQDFISKEWVKTDFAAWLTNQFDDMYKKYITNWEQIVKNNKVISNAMSTKKEIEWLTTKENMGKVWMEENKVWTIDTKWFKVDVENPLNEVLKKIKKNKWPDWNKIYTLWQHFNKFFKEDDSNNWFYFYHNGSIEGMLNNITEIIRKFWWEINWWISEKDFFKYTKKDLTPKWQNELWKVIRNYSPLEVIKFFDALYPNHK